MATFKDEAGRTWQVSLNTWALKVVREATGFEIGKLLDDGGARLVRLAQDPEVFVGVLWALCGEQARRDGVTEEQFWRGLAGDALADAYDAFRDAYTSFCPSRQRELLTAYREKEREFLAATAAAAMERITALDAAAAVRELTSNASAGGSPASPASTPAA